MIELKVTAAQIRELNSIYLMLMSDDQEQKDLGLSMLNTLDKTHPIWKVKRISKTTNKTLPLNLYLELAQELKDKNIASKWWIPLTAFIRDFTHFYPRFMSNVRFTEVM